MLLAGVACAWGFWLLESLIDSLSWGGIGFWSHVIPRDSHELWMRSLVSVLFLLFGVYGHFLVARINTAERERKQLRHRLEQALTKVLSGFLPICAGCKQIRLEAGDPNRQESWQPIEAYIGDRTDAEFSHSVCPACEARIYGVLSSNRESDDDYRI
jgi:hypothetical protein